MQNRKISFLSYSFFSSQLQSTGSTLINLPSHHHQVHGRTRLHIDPARARRRSAGLRIVGRALVASAERREGAAQRAQFAGRAERRECSERGAYIHRFSFNFFNLRISILKLSFFFRTPLRCTERIGKSSMRSHRNRCGTVWVYSLPQTLPTPKLTISL